MVPLADLDFAARTPKLGVLAKTPLLSLNGYYDGYF
jgi:hypothetical protein